MNRKGGKNHLTNLKLILYFPRMNDTVLANLTAMVN
jgi:hypothetical protein